MSGTLRALVLAGLVALAGAAEAVDRPSPAGSDLRLPVHGDVTGDGQTDLLRPAGNATWFQRGSEAGLVAAERRGLVSESDGHVELGAAGVQLHDVNGDGLADVVWLEDAYLKVYWGRGDGDEVVVEHDYVSNETDWVLFKPCETRTKEADGTVVAWSQTVYEASLTPANPATSCTGGAGDGRPRAVFGWLKDTHCGGSESGRWVKLEETAYDGYGNPTTLFREGVTRTLSYDAAAVFPASETVPCVAVTPIGMTWSVEAWDTTLGLPVRIKEPSGSEHEAVYDSLGRVTELWGQLIAASGVLEKLQSFSYDLTGPRPRVTTVVHEGGLAPDVETTAVFTATGAPLFEATRLASDSWIVGSYRHRNGRGLTDRVAMPFEVSSIAGVGLSYPTSGPDQTIAYDALGRAVEQVLPEVPGGPTGGATKSIAIEPLRVTTSADDLAPVLRWTDGQGRLAGVARDIPGAHAEAAVVSYDAAGRLVGYMLQAHIGGTSPYFITSEVGSATHDFCYDTLGRLVYGTDPDAGLRSYAWDDAGRLVGEENAAGDTLSYGYDCAGRLITRDAESATDPDLDESLAYVYDQSDFYGGVFTAMADGQWGRLAYVTSTSSDAWTHFRYDGQGRVIGLDEQVPSGPGGSGEVTRSSTTTYTPSGKVLEADYGRIHVEHAYDAAGRLSWLGYGVEGGTTALLYEPLELTPAGSPVWERLGNGVGTYFERDVLEQVTAMSVRDTGLTSGSVSAYQAAFANAAAVDIRYELDSITRTAYGAATVVVDSAVAPGNPRRDAVFGYDGAARLVSATLGETFDGSTSLGAYQFAYAYDGLQNLVQREAVALPAGAVAPRMASGAYEHGGSGYGPRQLAAVPSAGVTMSYDGAGRMVARTGGGFGAAMAYDAADRVRVVALGDDEVRHRYGPTGERSWTGWFDDDVLEREEYRFASGLALRNDRYELVVGLGGSRSLARISVPEVADTTHEVTYMHPGVGPGAVTFTDKAGALIEERLHEPFGVALGAIADYEQEPLGWNAKPVDPWTEWSDHGARWHATDLAHWLSPDPLLRGPDPELVNEFWRLRPYGFVAGNPIALWDPDGRSERVGGWCSSCDPEETRFTSDNIALHPNNPTLGELLYQLAIEPIDRFAKGLFEAEAMIREADALDAEFGQRLWYTGERSAALRAEGYQRFVAAAVEVTSARIGLPSGGARKAAVDPNRLRHIFGKAEHALDDFVKASGGQKKAFLRIQEAANAALKEGRLTVGRNGVLPRGDAGNIIDVGGTQIRLIGGRVVDGQVIISSASRKGLP